MSNIKKLMMSAAGGAGLDVDEVFSTYVYKGNSGSQTFVNGLDLAGEGGLVWSKRRDVAAQHVLVDSERNAGSYARILNSDNANPETIDYGYNWAFNSNGYSLNTTSGEINDSPREYCSWSFRKAPKFFDVVTYSGNSTAGRTVSHNLGTTPAWIFVKCRNVGEAWSVYYGDNTKDLRLDQALAAAATSNWNNTSPTDTNFTLGSNSEVNGNNNTYVAYLFANNNGDGEFGPSGDQDIIKCGSFTSGGQTNEEINLGFEAQFVLIKAISGPYNWETYDIMRGMGLSATTSTRGARLQPNRSDIENVSDYSVGAWENGFKYSGGINGTTYAYIAIRRGSLFPPESATEVFAMDTYGSTTPRPPALKAGFPVDFGFWQHKQYGGDWQLDSRLNQGHRMVFSSSAQVSSSASAFDYQTGYLQDTYVDSNIQGWMWKRALGFFDVVAYSGNSTLGRTVDHSLGVVPEMFWVKSRSGTYASSSDWKVYHKDVGNTASMSLQATNIPQTNVAWWNNTTPTDTAFTLGNGYQVNQSGANHIAFLFATLPGISKVGSYTGTTAAQTIDCGFTAGARFVLIKCISSSGGGWFVFDTERGITTTSNDGVLYLNFTQAQYTEAYAIGYNVIEPDNSGFKMTGSNNSTNKNGETYIFYAIA